MRLHKQKGCVCGSQQNVPAWFPNTYSDTILNYILWGYENSNGENMFFFKCLVLKLRHYEKATKLVKISNCFDKTPVCSVKTNGRFFQICVAFSEKLNFNYYIFISCFNFIVVESSDKVSERNKSSILTKRMQGSGWLWIFCSDNSSFFHLFQKKK